MKVFLNNRIFRQMLLNTWVSQIGDTLFYLALMGHIATYKFAPLAVLLISISENIPIILSFFIGSFADFQKNRTEKIIAISIIKVLLYGFVMLLLLRMKFSIIVVAIICVINLISDTISSFSGSMSTPIYMRVIKEDTTEAMGFAQASKSVFRLVGNGLGGILIGWISIQLVAGVNVLTFVFAFVGWKLISKSLKQYEEGLSVQKVFNFRNYRQHMWGSIKKMCSMSELMSLLISAMVSTVILSATFSIAVLVLKVQPFFHLNVSQSLALLNTSWMLGMISGNILSSKILTNIKLKSLVLLTQVFCLPLVLGFALSQFILVILFCTINAFLNGLLSPRIQKRFAELIPEESMGSIYSAIGLVDIVLPSLLTLAVVALATSLQLTVMSVILGVVLLVCIFFTSMMHKF